MSKIRVVAYFPTRDDDGIAIKKADFDAIRDDLDRGVPVEKAFRGRIPDDYLDERLGAWKALNDAIRGTVGKDLLTTMRMLADIGFDTSLHCDADDDSRLSVRVNWGEPVACQGRDPAKLLRGTALDIINSLDFIEDHFDLMGDTFRLDYP